jgi:stage II sporulation protein M
MKIKKIYSTTKPGLITKFYRFIYSNYKISLKDLTDIKNYIFATLGLFFIVTILGYFFPVFFADKIIELIKNLIEQTKDLGTLELISFIIYNNIQSAFFGIIFGIFFSIVSILIIITNAYILGFISGKSVELLGALSVLRLVPHGIFELPAIIISNALGIKLGLFLFICKEKNRFLIFMSWIRDALRIFVFIIVPLLIIAGIIEGLIIRFLG